jgi:tetratricopeptide (TPR) repeat protein
MRPSFQQIAELFQIELPGFDEDVLEAEPRNKEGKDAAESEDLGRQSLSDGDFETAIKHFKSAIEQRGEPSAAVQTDLAAAYEYGDLAPQAFRQYTLARKISQSEPEPLIGLSDLYKRHGRFRESVSKLEAALDRDPNTPFLYFKLAETLREMGERSRALLAAQRAVLGKPEEPLYHYWIGDLLIEMKRYEDALESLRAAIELSPGDDFLYLRAAVAFWRSDRKQEAVKAIRLASDLDPDKHVYHGLLEVLLENTDQQEEADLESQRADKMDRYDHDTLTRTLGEMGIET